MLISPRPTRPSRLEASPLHLVRTNVEHPAAVLEQRRDHALLSCRLTVELPIEEGLEEEDVEFLDCSG